MKHPLHKLLEEYAALLPVDRAAYAQRLFELAEEYDLTREQIEARLAAIDAARVVRVIPDGD